MTVRWLALATLAALAPAASATAAGLVPGPATLEAPGEDPRARFGDAVAVYGTTLAVGAPGEGPAGRVHLYEVRPGGPPEHAATVPPPDPDVRRFGAALALDGDRLLAGAPSLRAEGRVLVYDVDPLAAPEHAATLVPPAPEVGDRYGASLALDGDRVAVGAPAAEEGNGRVHLHRLDDLEAPTTATLAPADPAEHARLGHAVALADDRLLAGAPAGADGRGRLVLADPATGEVLDRAVGPAGGRALLGAALALARGLHAEALAGTPGAGPAALAYEVDDDRLAPTGAVPAPTARGRAGHALAAQDARLLVAEPGGPPPPDTRTREPPAVHAYKRRSDGWRHAGEVAATEDPHAGLGTALALAPAGTLLGAPTARAEDARPGEARWLPLAPAPATLADPGLTTWPRS